MGKIIKAKAQRVVANITSALSDEILTEEEVCIIIKTKIKEGYNDAGPQIFNALSLIFHTDKRGGGGSQWLTYFEQNQLQIDPQQILNEVKSEINKADEELAAKKKLQYSSYIGFNRYVQPFRFIVKAIYWLVLAALVLCAIPMILTYSCLYIVTNIMDWISNSIINLFSGTQYDLLLTQYQEEHFEYYKKSYLSEWRKTVSLNLGYTPQQLEDMCDEDFFSLYIASEVQISSFTELEKKQHKSALLAMHDEEIINSVTLNNFNRFILACKAFYVDLTQPLDNGKDLLIRAIKLLISPFILLLIAVNDLLNLSIHKGRVFVVRAAEEVFSAIIYVLNSPFFVYDYIRSFLRGNSFSSKCPDLEEVLECFHDKNNPLQRVIQYPGRQSDLEHEEPAQHGSLFNSKSSDSPCADLKIDEPDASLCQPD